MRIQFERDGSKWFASIDGGRFLLVEPRYNGVWELEIERPNQKLTTTCSGPFIPEMDPITALQRSKKEITELRAQVKLLKEIIMEQRQGGGGYDDEY